ncbi:MAG: sensor histidine kinase [Rudaea sp.]
MLARIFTPTDDSILIQYSHRSTSCEKPAHWLAVLMLVWTVWIFFVPMYQSGDEFRHWMLPTAVSFGMFLWLYWHIYYRSRAHVIWCAWTMAAMGLALTPLNPGAQCYIIYACAYFPSTGNTQRALRSIFVALVLYSVEWLFVLHFDWVYLINGVLVSLAIGFMNLNFVRKQQREAELRLSNEEVRRLAALAERERIGRDLHDLLGHTLSLITLKSELANRLFERDPQGARREIADVERVARDSLAQVRRAVTGIRAAGFAAELASAKLLLESNGIHFDYALADVALPAEIETALAMTLREAVTNAQRHARATLVNATLDVEGQRMLLNIVDNGRGGAIVPGNGLCGMRERLAAIGADLRIESQRGQGTRLRVSMALPQSAASEPVQTSVLLRHA